MALHSVVGVAGCFVQTEMFRRCVIDCVVHALVLLYIMSEIKSFFKLSLLQRGTECCQQYNTTLDINRGVEPSAAFSYNGRRFIYILLI
jgi:hypothetical protein